MHMYRRLALLVLVSLALAGCSRFARQWKQSTTAFQAPPAPSATRPAPDIQGPWEGQWASEAGHGSGRLRCILTRIDDRTYGAQFRATFWGILHGGYEVTLFARAQGDHVVLLGRKDLGWLGGGVYDYEGHITQAEFRSTYRSKADHGTMILHRPGAAPSTRPAPKTTGDNAGTTDRERRSRSTPQPGVAP